ncbi:MULTISPECIES: thiamine phosphate synthase [unclassified Nonomuraea]|uniref:thiamine phosphate synthase n=1 Tax=unclassified Nonomuraea TaxID=2593643 RepID=UPI0033EC59F2
MPRPSVSEARLYLCTDGRRDRGDLAEFLDSVLAGGVDIIQLREKGLEAREELALLEVFRDACDRHGKLLAVNDRADIAFAARPDVLHLGQDDLPVTVAREILGDDIVIGRSTHSVAEASAAAVEEGVDYFCCGPIWPTPTKPGRHAPGPALLRHAASLGPAPRSGAGSDAGSGARSGAARPWFGIGGIDLANLDEVMSYGVSRVVVVRAITDAEDPGAAAAEFAKRLTP